MKPILTLLFVPPVLSALVLALVFPAQCLKAAEATSTILRPATPLDPSKGLKDYAGKTVIGSKSSATGRSDSVIAVVVGSQVPRHPAYGFETNQVHSWVADK